MPGKLVSIEHDTNDQADTTVFLVPFNKTFDITRIEITNEADASIHVIGWDTFTDTDEEEHTSEAYQVKVFEYPVASLDGVVVDCQDKAKTVLGTLVARAYTDSGNIISNAKPVRLWVGGYFPF